MKIYKSFLIFITILCLTNIALPQPTTLQEAWNKIERLNPEEFDSAEEILTILLPPREASQGPITNSEYRKLTLKYHPDKNRDNANLAAEIFKKLNTAWETFNEQRIKKLEKEYKKKYREDLSNHLKAVYKKLTNTENKNEKYEIIDNEIKKIGDIEKEETAVSLVINLKEIWENNEHSEETITELLKKLFRQIKAAYKQKGESCNLKSTEIDDFIDKIDDFLFIQLKPELIPGGLWERETRQLDETLKNFEDYQEKESWYSILSIPSTATTKEIEKAYQKLKKQYSYDNDDPKYFTTNKITLEDILNLIKKAHETLLSEKTEEEIKKTKETKKKVEEELLKEWRAKIAQIKEAYSGKQAQEERKVREFQEAIKQIKTIIKQAQHRNWEYIWSKILEKNEPALLGFSFLKEHEKLKSCIWEKYKLSPEIETKLYDRLYNQIVKKYLEWLRQKLQTIRYKKFQNVDEKKELGKTLQTLYWSDLLYYDIYREGLQRLIKLAIDNINKQTIGHTTYNPTYGTTRVSETLINKPKLTKMISKIIRGFNKIIEETIYKKEPDSQKIDKIKEYISNNLKKENFEEALYSYNTLNKIYNELIEQLLSTKKINTEEIFDCYYADILIGNNLIPYAISKDAFSYQSEYNQLRKEVGNLQLNVQRIVKNLESLDPEKQDLDFREFKKIVTATAERGSEPPKRKPPSPPANPPKRKPPTPPLEDLSPAPPLEDFPPEPLPPYPQ